MLKKFYRNFFILIIIGFILLNGGGQVSSAASVEELQNTIQSHNEEIKKLDAVIARYRTEISKTKTESTSLKREIEKLELARTKLQADIAVTQNKISVADLNIQKLDQGIRTTAEKIEDNQKAIASALRSIANQEQFSLPELLVSQETPAEVWDDLTRYQSLSEKVEDLISDLRSDKKDLENDKQQKEVEKNQLVSLEDQLADQKKITEQTKQTKNTLLSDTKNKESNYQKLLADQLKKKEQVMAEMAKIETELKYTLDPSSIPSYGKNVLGWPVEKWILTQGFGNTAFSKSLLGAVYNGKGHNGIDLAAAIGDNIHAAESGQVIGVGDTDVTCKGASYGKWVLIRHNNGLSTLYAHLSSIKVSEGQTVTKGQIIAYSGNTGYSTGPHLHFSVFASDGVKVSSLQSKVAGCGIYRLPVASYSAYLNPLNYL